MKNNRGITLIALVITIIVLLILAGVSISMISGENGIVTKAKETARKTEEEEKKEQEELKKYEEFINSSVGYKKIKFTIILPHSSEIVEYEAEEGMTWNEWVESEYNVDGLVIYGGLVADSIKEHRVQQGELSNSGEKSSDTIQEGVEYYFLDYYDNWG